MISLKSFVSAIHDAIGQASDSLMERNAGLLNQYFEEAEPAPGARAETVAVAGRKLVAKTVTLEYPTVQPDLTVRLDEVKVPLITLVPLTTTRIEKAVLTTEFEMEVVDEEVRLNFRKPGGLGSLGRSNPTFGRLEVTFSPQEPTEGLTLVVEAFESTLKAQLL